MVTSNAAQVELIELSDIIKDTTPAKASDVKKLLTNYFNGIGFSHLKEEWDRMAPRQKRTLYEKLYKAYVKGQLPLKRTQLKG